MEGRWKFKSEHRQFTLDLVCILLDEKINDINVDISGMGFREGYSTCVGENLQHSL